MAIKKPGSRFTDRNKIRQMHREGYDINQIAEATSIVPEHVQYVLEEWDADEEAWRDRERARQNEEVRLARLATQPANPVPTIDDAERERIRQSARLELLEEQSKAAQDDTPDPAPEEPDAKTQAADKAAAEAEPEKPRRRRRQQAEGENAA